MREAALHNMGHLSKFRVTLLAGSEAAAGKSNHPFPPSLLSPKMILYHENMLWVKSCFNEVLLVFSQLNFLPEDQPCNSD